MTDAAARGSIPRWMPPAAVAAPLLGVAWMIMYYLAGDRVPVVRELGLLNMAFGLLLVLFGVATAVAILVVALVRRPR